MKNIKRKTTKNIIDLIRWFEEYQPEDLEQIERILTGLRYVDKDIMESNLKQDIYRNTRLLKETKFTRALSSLADSYRRIEANSNYNR